MSDYKIKLQDITKIKKNIKIAFVVGEFNKNYTSQLEKVNKDFLIKNGFEKIDSFYVPWAFEIPGMVKRLLKKDKYDLFLTFWVVIRWETPHFDYVCTESSRWLMDLTLKYETPIIFGILTCNSEKQVEERIAENYAISWLNLLAECKKN